MTTYRRATVADRPLLRAATLGNLNWVGDRFTEGDLDSTPAFAHYFREWPGDSDFGFVAEADGQDVGAVWVVQLTATDPGYGYVADDVPELSIWVADDHRGRGVGGALVDLVVRAARERGLRAISLSVEEGNPARRLYERAGFVPVADAAEGTLCLTLGAGRF